ncbi:MAG: hypothetical protein ABIL58_09930 [Pseudomonadota bacterium]
MNDGETVEKNVEPCIVEAIALIERFVGEVSGWAPTQAEIARTLKRYFILYEINEQIQWQRENPDL